MLSIVRCVSRRTINSFSTIKTISCERQTKHYQKRFYSRHDAIDEDHKHHKQDKDQSSHFGDYGDTDEANGSKSRSQTKYKTFSECSYHLLKSRLLETFGWLGAAIVVGLNFENRYFSSKCAQLSQSRREVSPQTIEKLTAIGICGDCKYCHSMISKLIAFATPAKTYTNPRYVLSSNNNNNNNNNKDNNSLTSGSSEERSESSRTSDPIDEICKQLESASIDYIEQLNNMLGIALIQTDPEEAMQCWSNCKQTAVRSKALFNMGVAFETGRHSSSGAVDLKRAHDHYALSAYMGHKQAIYNLSLFYLYGKGQIEVDLNRANALLERAAQLGVKQAKQFCESRLKSQNRINKCDKFNENPILKSSASAPNLSVMTHSFYDSVISEKSYYNNE